MFATRHEPPYRTAGAIVLALLAITTTLTYLQFRGDFTPRAHLTLLSPRSGLVVDPGSKVTYNGVEIGRVAAIDAVNVNGGTAQAQLTLDIDPRYLAMIPANVVADVTASTVFGNKYVAFRSPERPSPERLLSGKVIVVASVTTEVNTLFETVTAIAEKVDPVKLNTTLTATAQALGGLGDRFGDSVVNANSVLDDLNSRMPQIRYETRRLADLAALYADASPELWDGLRDTVVTAQTLNRQRGDVDAALMSALGFANTATDPVERSGPYLVRGAADLVPTTQLLDEYRGMIFCTIRNYSDVAPEIYRALGGDNGYSLAAAGTPIGAANPYVYPDNLPRVNAHGGPEGRPGCWQKITRELWPAPYLVTDTGFSLAPYNHMELGQPLFTEYVWGRQFGGLTINP